MLQTPYNCSYTQKGEHHISTYAGISCATKLHTYRFSCEHAFVCTFGEPAELLIPSHYDLGCGICEANNYGSCDVGWNAIVTFILWYMIKFRDPFLKGQAC